MSTSRKAESSALWRTAVNHARCRANYRPLPARSSESYRLSTPSLRGHLNPPVQGSVGAVDGPLPAPPSP